jgi:hypothetical protein
MEELGIPLKFVNLNRITMRNVKCKIRIQNKLPSAFQTHHSLKQGDGLA